MKKIYQLILLIISLIFTFEAAFAENSFIDISLQDSYTKKIGQQEYSAKLNIKKIKESSYDDIISKYQVIKKDFDREYDNNRKLISESSTVMQAFNHSKSLLNTCIKYTDRFGDLKAQALLQLLVGKWSGNLNVKLTKTTKTQKFFIKRNLKISFETNQAGQISKAVVKGDEEILREQIGNNKHSKPELAAIKKENRLKGSILGILVPEADTNLSLYLDAPDGISPEIKDTYDMDIKGKLNIDMVSPVKQEVLDEAYSLTVSHMKIYYNLLFKSRRTAEEILKDKYNLFFRDILFLINITSSGYVTKEVYKPLNIYPGSDYVTDAFEDYTITLSSYYARVINKTYSTKHKLEVYKRYFDELINASALCQLGIVNVETARRLNIKINEAKSLFDQVFERYYKLGFGYYNAKLQEASDDKKEEVRKELTAFLKEMIDITKTGLISKEMIKEFGITQEKLKSI
jgi:hypothetical protein